MKKFTGIAAVVILLFISGIFNKAEAATQQASCSKTSFQIQLKASGALKDKPDPKAKILKTLPANQKLGVLQRTGGWYKVCYANKASYIAATNTKEIYSAEETLLLSKFKTRTSVKQVLAVMGNKLTDTKVSIKAYEYNYGEWRRALSPMAGVIGKKGLTANKNEGDGKTPMGIFSFGAAFGSAAKPSGMNWPYKKTTKYDYWIDDPSSMDYNKWITTKYNPSTKWRSFERMNHELYKYGAVINYNTNPIVKGKGSAIFLHIWRGPNSTTAGCTATAENNVIRILKWMNPQSKPHIVVSTMDYLKKMK